LEIQREDGLTDKEEGPADEEEVLTDEEEGLMDKEVPVDQFADEPIAPEPATVARK
jgi:hypothetical protein